MHLIFDGCDLPGVQEGTTNYPKTQLLPGFLIFVVMNVANIQSISKEEVKIEKKIELKIVAKTTVLIKLLFKIVNSRFILAIQGNWLLQVSWKKAAACSISYLQGSVQTDASDFPSHSNN